MNFKNQLTMKKTINIFSVAAFMVFSSAIAQTTEAEKQLRTVSSDTVLGWK